MNHKHRLPKNPYESPTFVGNLRRVQRQQALQVVLAHHYSRRDDFRWLSFYGETLGDSQVEVRFLVLVTQIHHFFTWKPRFDPTLHTICLYLFIREVIANMPFSILASLVQAWKQEKTTICCYGCIIESRTSATTTTFRELCSKKRWRFQRLSTGKKQRIRGKHPK